VEDDLMSTMTRWGVGVVVAAVAGGVVVEAVGRGDSVAHILAIFMAGVAVGIGLTAALLLRVSVSPTNRSA
jgi:hypothetical protein